MTRKLPDFFTSKGFRLEVKQHAAVLDYVTAIEDEMNRRSMTQQALATLLNKSRAWISKVLRKKPNLTFFTAVEIADALNMDVRVEVTPRSVEAEETVHVPPLPGSFTERLVAMNDVIELSVPFERAAA
jgi:transcriptional regulator with XRE-family HTH domain